MQIIGELVQDREVFTIAADTTALEAARFMTGKGIGLLPVMDGDKVIGVFTERDLMKRVVAADLDPAQTRISEVMTRQMICASPDESYQ